MFHWICPECGREIPPSVRECQACDPSAAASSVVEPILAVAEFKPVPEPKIEAKPIAEPAPLVQSIVPPPLPLLLEAAREPVAETPSVPSAESTPVVETPPAEAIAVATPPSELVAGIPLVA